MRSIRVLVRQCRRTDRRPLGGTHWLPHLYPSTSSPIGLPRSWPDRTTAPPSWLGSGYIGCEGKALGGAVIWDSIQRLRSNMRADPSRRCDVLCAGGASCGSAIRGMLTHAPSVEDAGIGSKPTGGAGTMLMPARWGVVVGGTIACTCAADHPAITSKIAIAGNRNARTVLLSFYA